MKDIRKIYNLETVKDEDGRILIDIELLKLILELEGLEKKNESSFDTFATPVEKVNTEVTHEEPVMTLLDGPTFRKKLMYLFRECLMKGPYPWRNPNCIFGEAPHDDLPYDKEKIAQHKEEIAELLSYLKDPTFFEDLMILKDGTYWTIVRQQISILMTLANAAGLMELEIPKYESVKINDNNPKILLKK